MPQELLSFKEILGSCLGTVFPVLAWESKGALVSISVTRLPDYPTRLKAPECHSPLTRSATRRQPASS